MNRITPESVRREYRRGVAFNHECGLYEKNRRSDEFFIGKQWEGTDLGDLPTPVFNFIRRSVIYAVQSIASSSISTEFSVLGGGEDALERAVNSSLNGIFECNDLVAKFEEILRDAAMHGDGCMLARWDADAFNAQGTRGAIVAELVDTDRVFFGSPATEEVEDQPYIIISRRELTETVRRNAESRGLDTEELRRGDEDDDGRVTVLLRFWKNSETGTVWCGEYCSGIELRAPWDTGLSKYPIIWMPWDSARDSYHGQSLITAMIPNQIFVNKLFAMSMLSLMTTAHPKIVYDRTRIAKWDNRVGAAIPMLGGDINNVARVIEPANLSPQVAQFIDMTVSYSQTLLGATPAALGEVRPDNSSAIIALQKASSIPNEMIRQKLYRRVERFIRIIIDMMGEYYGTAKVGGETVDFKRLKTLGPNMRVEVGSAAYWSEYSMIGTLDNLLTQGRISFVEYLERVPDAHLPGRKSLLDRVKRDAAAVEAAAGAV